MVEPPRGFLRQRQGGETQVVTGLLPGKALSFSKTHARPRHVTVVHPYGGGWKSLHLKHIISVKEGGGDTHS